MSNRIDNLVKFIVDVKFDDLPHDLKGKCKRHILDTLGAALAGSGSDVVKTAMRVFDLYEETGKSLIWGIEKCMSPRNAAFINGISAHAFELDDSGGCDHSGAVVLPALIAAVEMTEKQISGEEFITATVVGYEVGRRVLESCGGYSPHNSAGWHSTSTCGVFGAAAACARIFGLDAGKITSALGISGSFSGGLWAFIHDGSLSKRLHTGRAAEGGLLAAMMAKEGITGPAKIFDDVWGGFLNTFAGEDAIPEALDDTLWNIWKLNRCSIKPYASCRGTHSAIDAVGILLENLDIGPSDIKEIEVEMCPFLMDMCGSQDISTLAAAQMSLPYALAARLVYGKAGLNEYSEEHRKSADINKWFDKIKLKTNDRLSEDGEPIIRILCNDGRNTEICVEVPLGSPDNPVSDEQLMDKYIQLSSLTLPTEKVHKLSEKILNLDKIDDMKQIVSYLKSG